MLRQTFEVKPLGNGWYYRCAETGLGVHNPFKGWTKDEAIQQAMKKAKQHTPAEIVVYDEYGLSVIAAFLVGSEMDDSK